MARTKSELIIQARQFGLSEEGTCDQLMDRLRDHFVQRDNLDILPQLDVMCAHNAKDFLDYTLEKPWRSEKMMKYWNDPNWVVEPKLDGVRVKAHYSCEGNQYIRLDSRRRSDVNYVYAEKTENFPHLQLPWLNNLDDTILDGELMPPPGVNKIWNGAMWVEGLNITTSIWNSGRETALNLQQNSYLPGDIEWGDVNNKGNLPSGCLLHYHAFDILKYKGEWITHKPWYARREILRNVVSKIREQNKYYHYTSVWTTDANWSGDGKYFDFEESGRLGEFENLLEQGGEGVMFKRIDSKYIFGKRSWDWLKLKRFETIDCVVMGSIDATVGKGWEGKIGAFKLGCTRAGELIHVASCSSMDMVTRDDASLPDGSLNPSYMGKVAEVRMQAITTRSMRGRHAVLVRWRPDKTPDQCSMDQIKSTPHEMFEE